MEPYPAGKAQCASDDDEQIARNAALDALALAALGPDTPPMAAPEKSSGRFQKGVSGNPGGRPRKASQTNRTTGETISRFMAMTVEEIRELRRKDMTLRDLSLLRVCTDSLHLPVSQVVKLFANLDSSSGVQTARCGVLVVPGVASQEEWEKSAAISQARFRENTGEDPDDSTS